MSPFRRGEFWSLYVPRRSGGVVQRACGTTDGKLAKAMGRMIDTLADQRRWDVLEAIDAQRVTVGQVYDAYCMNGLEALMLRAGSEAALPRVDAWLDTLPVATRTRIAYEQKVRALVTEGMVATDFTAGWINDRIAQLPQSSGTRGQYLHALSLFLDYLVGHGLLPTNPIHQRGLVRRPKANPPRMVWKREADDLRLVRSAPSPFREYFALVHGSGAERDAALAMTRAHVDLTRWVLHIPGTKTKTRDRKQVPLDAWARPFVAALCKGLLPDAPLFPTLTRGAINHAHRAARDAAKLPGYQLRDARHSFAMRHLIRGEPLWKVSKWLGHSNQMITARVYTQTEIEEALAYETELNRRATRRTTSGGAAS
ncbi:MAG: tyrosine-type recombinase/integrase [Gemmatimonadaceae bacterium]|nr:tyrosine-type recombinase/integrase [Gemmatimonadaceae bacterium]